MHAGQAQKEAFVNEVAMRLDALVHGAIEGEAAAPPASPVDGECWLVAANPTGDWSGHAGQVAVFGSGGWLFCEVRDGMRLLNRNTGQDIRFHSSWHIPVRPSLPAGGATIDVEARTALAAIVAVLTEAGIVPAS